MQHSKEMVSTEGYCAWACFLLFADSHSPETCAQREGGGQRFLRLVSSTCTLLVIGVVSLSTLLPSPPGFLGTLQFAFAIAVSTFGYSWSQGIAAATVTQVFLLGSLVAIGLALLLAAYSSRVYRDAKLLRPSSGRPT